MNKENLLQIQYFLSDNNVCKFTFISEIMKSFNSPDYSFFRSMHWQKETDT